MTSWNEQITKVLHNNLIQMSNKTQFPGELIIYAIYGFKKSAHVTLRNSLKGV